MYVICIASSRQYMYVHVLLFICAYDTVIPMFMSRIRKPRTLSLDPELFEWLKDWASEQPGKPAVGRVIDELIARFKAEQEQGMGKGFAPHRVVVRDDYDRIVSDQEFEHFAAAEPVYREAAAAVRPGELVTLQHGARIIFKASGEGAE